MFRRAIPTASSLTAPRAVETSLSRDLKRFSAALGGRPAPGRQLAAD